MSHEVNPESHLFHIGRPKNEVIPKSLHLLSLLKNSNHNTFFLCWFLVSCQIQNLGSFFSFCQVVISYRTSSLGKALKCRFNFFCQLNKVIKLTKSSIEFPVDSDRLIATKKKDSDFHLPMHHYADSPSRQPKIICTQADNSH